MYFQTEINVGHDVKSRRGIKDWGKQYSVSQTVISGRG